MHMLSLLVLVSAAAAAPQLGTGNNFNQDFNQDFNQNFNLQDFNNPILKQDVSKNFNQNFDQNFNQNFDQNLNQNFNQNFKQNFDQNLKQNFNQKSSNQQQFNDNGSEDVTLLNLNFEQDDEGNYEYSYEQSNGQKVEQVGRVQRGPKPETGSLEQQGSYKYVGDDGKTYEVTYTANERGFQPKGEHLPTPPPQIAEYEKLRRERPELFWAENGGAGVNQQKFSQ